jgi:hypothetical protein
MSTALLVVFLVPVILAALPPRVLDLEWQLGVIGALVSNGALALVGFLLVPLAAWIDPESRRLHARAMAFRRWSTAAALGFLLLAPLQGFAAWQVLRNVDLSRSREFDQSSRQFAHLREAVSSSTSSEELSSRVQALPGGTDLLPAVNASTALPQLKKELLSGLELGEKQLQQRRLEASAIRSGPPLRETLRLALSALAYAYAFAFAAGLLRWGPNRFSTVGKSASVVDEHYYQKLSNEETTPSL